MIEKDGNDTLSHEHKEEKQVLFHLSMGLQKSSVFNSNNNNNNNNIVNNNNTVLTRIVFPQNVALVLERQLSFQIFLNFI